MRNSTAHVIIVVLVCIAYLIGVAYLATSPNPLGFFFEGVDWLPAHIVG